MKVRIPIFNYPEDAPYNAGEAMDIPLDECTPVDMIFYTVDNLSVWYDFGQIYTCVRSGGEMFISHLTMCEVERLIDQAHEHEKVNLFHLQ